MYSLYEHHELLQVLNEECAVTRELSELYTQEAKEVTGVLLVPQVCPLIVCAAEDGLIFSEVGHQQEEDAGAKEHEEVRDLNVEPVAVRCLTAERYICHNSILSIVETEHDGHDAKAVRDDDVKNLGLIEHLPLLKNSHEDGQVQRLH